MSHKKRQVVLGTSKEILIQALSLCAHMGTQEWDFIVAIPPPSRRVPSADHCIRKGLVKRKGKWVTLTQRGIDRLDPRVSPSWFLALARMPCRGTLHRLARKGLIECTGGFPTLTHLGAVIRTQILEDRKYFAAHPDFSTDENILYPS